MRYILACDDDGHFHVYQLSQRKELYTLITEEVGGGDLWSDRNSWDYDGPVVNNANDFNALSDQQVEDLLLTIAGGRGRVEKLDLDPVPVRTEASDRLPVKQSQGIEEPDEMQKKRAWRKTLLSFTLAYPDLFGGDSASVSADLIENAIHVIDLLPSPWEDHITSINPGQGLCIEILLERDGSEVSMKVDRKGCSFHIKDVSGIGGIEDRINSTSWDMDYFEKCWESRKMYVQNTIE
jgi:hypothetical protein